MKIKRKLALGLLVALLLSMIPAAAAEEGGETPPVLPEIPQVTVVGTKVTGDQYFEVGLNVSAKQFQSVGVVLSYDSKKLELTDWVAGSPIAVAETASAWQTPTVIPTKGMDDLAGKPALACKITGDSRAYLYLGADTLAYTGLNNQRVVTVRFQYVDETKPDDVTMPVEAGDTPGLTPSAFTVDIAPAGEDAVAKSIPGAQVVATTDAATMYVMNTLIREADAYSADFVLGSGSSANTGGGASGDFAITMFDWDGRVIDVITAPADATEAVNQAMQRPTMKDTLAKKKGYQFDRWLVVAQTVSGLQIVTRNGTTGEPDRFTSNDEKIPSTSNVAIDLSNIAPYIIDPKSKGVMLQAAYVAKSAANGNADDFVNNGSTDNLDKYYTTSAPVYSRYGSADAEVGSYSLKIDALRQNTKGGTTYGVTRLRKPAIIVTMKVKADHKNIVSLIELENTDEASFEVVPTKAIEEVSFKVVDIYGVANWPGSADKSDANITVDSNTFIREGTRGFLAEQARIVKDGGTWDTTIDAQAFADAYQGVSGAGSKNTTAYWTAAKQTNAKNNLKNATPAGIGLLTSAQVKAALDAA